MKASPLILLVDDSPFFLSIERQFLRKSLVEVVEAANATDALALCREKKPQLVYLGFDLPDRNGAECCRLIKGDTRLRGTAVVVVCNEQRLDQQELSRQAGCNAVLTKPLDRHRFLEIGRSFLAGIREQRRSCLIRVRAKTGVLTFSAKGLDISSGGLFLECPDDLPPGTALDLELQLSRPDGNGPWLRLSGIIAWRNTRDKPFKPHHPVGFGVKFVNLTPETVTQLYAFLKQLEL